MIFLLKEWITTKVAICYKEGAFTPDHAFTIAHFTQNCSLKKSTADYRCHLQSNGFRFGIEVMITG
jgi:hypothetical protein